MKRFVVVILVLAMLAVSFVPSIAQDAPEGVFLGTWPYVLPPDHNLNSFATNGVGTNLGNIFRQMVELPSAFYVWASQSYEPMLASEFGFTDDNTGYTITLNADAKWSDGSDVTADDVIATYAIGRILGWSDFNYIAEVEKVDDDTVLFVFKAEASLLAERLILRTSIRPNSVYGELAAQALQLHADGLTKDAEEWTALSTAISEFRPDTLLATGPYTYSMEDVGDSYLTLKWQPNSIYSDDVKFGEIRLWAGETEATTPLVLNGDISFSTNVYPPATQQAIQDAGIRMLTLPRGYGPALLFNHDVAPWNIKEVRQAIAYIIDRDENAFITNGFGATGTEYMAGILDSMVPTLIDQASIDKLNRYEFNPDAATALLEGIGFSKNADGKWMDAEGNVVAGEYKFPAEFADFSGAAQNATDQMNEFGFDITPRAVPWQQAAEDIRNGEFELSVWSWAQGSPFATQQFFGPVQRFNYVALAEGQKGMNFPMEFEYNGATIDLNAMINAVSGGLDVEAQRARAGEVALIINDLLPYIPLNVILSTEPWNEAAITGGPADDDAIMQNPTGTDHFAVWYLLTGLIAPA